MDCLLVSTLTLALTHVVLLAVVFFGTSLPTHAFVSTEIHAQVFFRVLLTVIVYIEAAVGVTYIFVQGQGPLRRFAAVALAAVAMGGWALVASFPTENPAHLAGAATFIATTAAYSLLFIARSLALKCVLYAMWALTVAAAVAFGGLYWSEHYAEAAVLEWVAFLADAFTLLLFYYVNPPTEVESHTNDLYATHPRDWQIEKPLLHPGGEHQR